MPRFIDSLIGDRQIAIPEATDRFTAANAIVDGTAMLQAGTNTAGSPPYCHAFDRAAGASVYAIYSGQPRTIAVWIEGFTTFTFPYIGCQFLNTPTSYYWYLDRVSGSGQRRFQVRNSSAGMTALNTGVDGTSDGGSPEMCVLTWSGVDGVSANLKSYGNGVLRSNAAITSVPTEPTDAQLFVGRAANQALSVINPLTTSNDDPQFAKLTVWNRELTGSEIADLYAAMAA